MVACYFWLLWETKCKQLALNENSQNPGVGVGEKHHTKHWEDNITSLVYSQSDDPV